MKNLILALLFFAVGKISAQLTPEQWRADLQYLGAELPRRHPDFFKNHREADFRRDLKALSDNLAGRSDLEIALAAQSLVARAADAHTRIDLKPVLQSQKPIPIGLGWYADGVYVSGTVKGFEKILGKKILKVNGLEIGQVAERLGRFVPRENDFALRKDVWQFLRFPEACRLAGIANSDTLELLLETAPGQTETRRIFPLDLNNPRDMQPASFQPSDPDLCWQPPQGPFTAEWLATDSILYLRYYRCLSSEMSLAAGDSVSASRLPEFGPFADSLIAFMARRPGARLFIDLRFNSGGGASDGIGLARRIAEIPALNRPDRLFVATNLYTFSSAVQIGAFFGEKTNATLVGEPTAERPNHFGEVRSFGLPNSQLTVYYSTKFMRMVPGDPATLQPDVLIDMRFEDFRQGKDPVLDYVRNVARR